MKRGTTLFVEPCPGCFENRLRELSEMPGGAVFLGAGDFTLSRLIAAMSTMMHGGEVALSAYRLEQSTVDILLQLKDNGSITEASVIYEVTDINLKQCASIRTARVPTRAFVVSMRRGEKYMTVTGMFTQDAASHCLECFAMMNDPGQQRQLFHHLIRKAANNS